MKKKLLLLFVSLSCCMALQAQKKSELIAEINELKVKLDSTENLVRASNRREKVSLAKAESFETQVTELQAANATLLQNLNSFAEVSNKNSSAVNQALASLEEKENQLKGITSTLSSNDSTAIVLLTNAKQTLGEESKVKVANSSVIISAALKTIFVEETGDVVSDSALPWLEKVSEILKANPNVAITFEGLSMTGELDLAAKQATAVASLFQKNFGIDPNRMASRGKDGNFKEGLDFKLHPKFDAFYLMVKEDMKN